MATKQHTERPLRVWAEQYLAATVPPITGVCTLTHYPFTDGRPHVHIHNLGMRDLVDTDVLVWNFDQPTQLDAVMTQTDFENRYGPVT